MTVAVAAMMQDTNTFSHLRTAFEDFITAKGEAVYQLYRELPKDGGSFCYFGNSMIKHKL